MKNKIFWIFGSLQALSLAVIIFLLFELLGGLAPENAIGRDTQIALSVAFPLFLLLTQYIMHTNSHEV